MNVLARFSLTPSKAVVAEGARIVRNVLANYPSGLTTNEIFQLALKEQPLPDFKPETSAPKPAVYGRGAVLKKTVPLPPHPEHPVQSMRFLKKAILSRMAQAHELKHMRTMQPSNSRRHILNANYEYHEQPTKKGKAPPAARMVETWVWKPVDPKRLPKPPPPPGRRKPVWGEEVGVGEDWSHLNKRRRRARSGKVRRDLDLARPRFKLRVLLAAQAKAAAEKRAAEQAAAEKLEVEKALAKAEKKAAKSIAKLAGAADFLNNSSPSQATV